MTDKASVVVIAYNMEKFATECIQSVLAQTHKNLELIVINDGSTDETESIILSFNDGRICYVPISNCGPSRARNLGASKATGDFISFLDADDWWYPQKLESDVRAFKLHPEAGLAWCSTDTLLQQSNLLVNRPQSAELDRYGYRELLYGNFIGNCSHFTVRQAVWKEFGGFDCSLSHAEDWEFLLRVASKYELAYAGGPYGVYRIRSDSLSMDLNAMEECGLKVIEKAFAAAPVLANAKKTLL